MVKYGLKTTNIDGKIFYREYLGEIVRDGEKQNFVGGDFPQAKEIELSQDELLKNNPKRKTIITIVEEE